MIAGTAVLPADEAAGGAPVEGVPTSFAAGVTLEASVAAATIRGIGSAGLALASESRPTACEYACFNAAASALSSAGFGCIVTSPGTVVSFLSSRVFGIANANGDGRAAGVGLEARTTPEDARFGSAAVPELAVFTT